MESRKMKLPCAIGDKVYSIDVNYAPCNICPHGKSMKNSPRICADSEKNYECPSQRYTVRENICEAFVIDKNGVSLPGRIDPYDGFCSHAGCDDQVYYSKEKAALMAEICQKRQRHYNG